MNLERSHVMPYHAVIQKKPSGSRHMVLSTLERLLSTLHPSVDAGGSSRGSSRYCRLLLKLLSAPQAASVNVPDSYRC
ncbi:hypothetical protein PENPOL_c003G02764 [Penicillium polonicum]|uniref:Uncharacterized protein n=1 Tax=Penicillium polonicum TaxID=60169 RepID=A0A1V6NUI7_PENPO|nr:hypothetical protein PENPOL_c003G02764 [Penicillium polonicum]